MKKKKNRNKKRNRTKKERYEEYDTESDEFYFFIAGYTENGAAYGITWEEAREKGLIEDDEEHEYTEEQEYTEKIPF